MWDCKRFINRNNPHLNKNDFIIPSWVLIKANRYVRRWGICQAQQPAPAKNTVITFLKNSKLQRTIRKTVWQKTKKLTDFVPMKLKENNFKFLPFVHMK